MRLLAIVPIVYGLAAAMATGSDAKAQTTKSALISGPKIQFAQPNFNFGKVDSGQIVKHDFIFTNTGNQRLEITEARPSCGCMTVGTWDKQVEPGETGVIQIELNSSGYAGPVTKAVTVICNDPAQPTVILYLSGTIWKPIDVTPQMAMFTPGPDGQTNDTRVLKIVNNLEEPVNISKPVWTNDSFQVELKPVREGMEYELRVTARAPFGLESRSTAIILKTSSPRIPELVIKAILYVQPAVTVSPLQISIPPGPLANVSEATISIQNNTTNSLKLSEPGVNVEGATARLQEIQPGRTFILSVIFPVGFTNQPGNAIEIHAKSNHPQYPMITVPVYQQAPAVPGPSAAAPAH
jgi:hypothetical protein